MTFNNPFWPKSLLPLLKVWALSDALCLNANLTARGESLTGMLAQLKIMRSILEKQVADPEGRHATIQMINQLSDVSDTLHSWIGQEKYSVPKERIENGR